MALRAALTETPGSRSRFRRRAHPLALLVAFALAITYGGVLWMVGLHELEGVHESAELPLVLHWLRDGNLALPLVLVAVWLGMRAWRRLSTRFSPLRSTVGMAFALALATSVAFAAGTPVHGILFGAEHDHAGLAAESPVGDGHPGHDHAASQIVSAPGTADVSAGVADEHGAEAAAAAASPASAAVGEVGHAIRDGLRAFPAILLITLFISLLLGEPAAARRGRVSRRRHNARSGLSHEPGRLPLGLWAGTALGVVGLGVAADRLVPALALLTAGAVLVAIVQRHRLYAWLGWMIVRLQARAIQSPIGMRRPALGTVMYRRLAAALLGAALLVPQQATVTSAAPVAQPESVSAAADAPPACRAISADVVALDQTIVYNRLGVIDPEGMIFALRQDVVPKVGTDLAPGNVQLRPDKRPRPLTLRMNVGDCLTVNFENLLGPAVAGQIQTRKAGISVLGMQLKNSILSDGSNVGENATTTGTPSAGLVAPGGTATYTFYAEREGAYELYSPTDNVSAETIGVLAHGLFGAVNVEPTGAEWYRSQVTRDDMDLATGATTGDGHPVINYDAVYPAGHRFAGQPILKMLDGGQIVHSDLTAIITGPGRGNFGQGGSPAYPPNPTYPNRNQPFREFTIVFHDEAAVVQAFPQFSDPAFAWTLHGVRDGKAINYGTGGVAAEVLANRLGVGPTADCPECKLEEFFLTSWALGDPAQVVDVPANTTDANGDLVTGPKATKVFYPDDPSNVYHSYINDHTKFRNIHVGKEHHIFHLHSHQWLETPDDDNSSYLDSQAIGPGATYTYEIAYGGSGNRNKTPGDAIFHCHFYPHFAQGMWALWRSHDVFERGTQLDADGRPIVAGLPDGEIDAGTPTPALIPIPGIPMAPTPGVESKIVGGQVDVAGPNGSGPDGVADFTQGWPAPAGNPGYPFYIPGVAGHRPPTPALDMTDPATGAVMDGGLPRHVIIGGTATATTTNLDLSKVVDTATAVYPPEAGTPAERQAMAFHAQLRHDTFLPDGSQATAASGFETNGLPPAPGAPYAEPCRNDNGTFNRAAPLRIYKGADIQLDMKLNKLGWHFPQARMLALWQDVGPMLSGQAAPEPFVMRANSGDCINYYHANLVPGVYEQDAYQVRTPTDIIGQHIHLVKFDVTASDGSGNGFNYEDGTLSPDEVRERIAAIRAQNNCTAGTGAPDDTTCPVAAAHPFFGPGPSGAWLGARTTIQRWWADPVVNNAGQDRTLGNVYTHDHYGPSTHQQTGLYATLIIEPSKSLWRDSETGKCYGDTSIAGRTVLTDPKDGGCTPVTGRTDGGPTSWRADVLTADNASVGTSNFDKESFREFYFEFSDFQHAYVAGKGATFANRTVTIGGKNYAVPVATLTPDPLHAINPAGAIQNPAVSAAQPWLKVKPTLEGQADVCPALSPLVFTAAGCPETISTADIGTFSMNYRNEPVAARVIDPATMSQAAGDAGDLSLAFSSNITRKDTRLNSQPTFYPPLTLDVKPGDPYTPMMRVYEADKVRVKIQVGATEEGHNASLWGAKWLQEYASPNSGWRNSQMMGISEQFNWDTETTVDPAQKGQVADHMFSPDNSVDGMWNGMWSLMRSYSQFRAKKNAPLGTDLLPLPNNRLDKKTGQVNTVKNLSAFDKNTQYQCPIAAPKVAFNVTAVLARDALPDGTLVYNSRTANGGPLHDPTAILYVRSSDLDASGKLKAGVPIEPLVLRAKAGDCLTLNLKNRLPAATAGPLPDLPGNNLLPPIIDRFTVSSTAVPGTVRDTFNANDVRPSNRVGLRPQLVAYDPTRGAGNSVGGNSNNTVAPGGTKVYFWYAGDLSYEVATGTITATPMEFGAANLVSSDPVKHSNKGAIGALIIEPSGATWTEDAGSRAQATVTMTSGSKFRDFALLFQDDINMRFGANGTLADGGPVPFVAGADDAEDTGMKGLNYRTEPLWFRLGIDPAAQEAVIKTFDFTNALANGQVGGADPQTPVFTASPNQAIRLRVLEPNGHARNHVFALHGHVWERNPYTSSCTQTPCKGSTSIGHNATSQWVGSQEGHGPTDHWDIVPRNGAGGAYGVTGDYLYRDMSSVAFYNGTWGILRVRQ